MLTRAIPPIVVDLGTIASPAVKRLRTGEGQIADDVKEVMRLIRLRDPQGSNRVFVPIVMLYTKAKTKFATRMGQGLSPDER